MSRWRCERKVVEVCDLDVVWFISNISRCIWYVQFLGPLAIFGESMRTFNGGIDDCDDALSAVIGNVLSRNSRHVCVIPWWLWVCFQLSTNVWRVQWILNDCWHLARFWSKLVWVWWERLVHFSILLFFAPDKAYNKINIQQVESATLYVVEYRKTKIIVS